jgi:hypothetical protein
VQRLALPGGTATWTVVGADHGVVGPAEEFLEYLRVQGTSPNTVKSYARALALWWSYLGVFGLGWDGLSLADVGGFLAWLRSGDGPEVVSIGPRSSRFAESTISTRLRAVTSCYRFHELNGVALGGDLVRVVHGGRAVYRPMLEHVARRTGRQRSVIRVRTPRNVPPPVLAPGQIERILSNPRDDGGLEELSGFCPSRASSSAIRSSALTRAAFVAANSATASTSSMASSS